MVVADDLQNGRPGWMRNVVVITLAKRVVKARCTRDGRRLQSDLNGISVWLGFMDGVTAAEEDIETMRVMSKPTRDGLLER